MIQFQMRMKSGTCRQVLLFGALIDSIFIE
ncbi:MAG: hypothetical protein KatS3mg111_3455 [Pirellulaceae bacterium]|nr:MAG: hypothetical protein KatS3mg111_3455 [Pirellulaceae bacterium]